MKITCLQKTEAKFWGENLLSVYITYSSTQVFYVLVSRFLFSITYFLIFGKSLIIEN